VRNALATIVRRHLAWSPPHSPPPPLPRHDNPKNPPPRRSRAGGVQRRESETPCRFVPRTRYIAQPAAIIRLHFPHRPGGRSVSLAWGKRRIGLRPTSTFRHERAPGTIDFCLDGRLDRLSMTNRLTPSVRMAHPPPSHRDITRRDGCKATPPQAPPALLPPLRDPPSRLRPHAAHTTPAAHVCTLWTSDPVPVAAYTLPGPPAKRVTLVR